MLINIQDGITPLEVARVHGHESVCTELEKESQLELNQSKVCNLGLYLTYPG